MRKVQLLAIWTMAIILLLFGQMNTLVSLLGEEKGVFLLFMLLVFGEFAGILTISLTLNEHKNLQNLFFGIFLLGFMFLWIWSWDVYVGLFDTVMGLILVVCSALKSVHMLLARDRQLQFRSYKQGKTNVRIIDELASDPRGAVFLGLLFSALSFIYPYIILHSEPLFDIPTAFVFFYMIGSIDFGIFYYPSFKQVLFLGFAVHGGLTFAPFGIAYVVLSYLRLDTLISIFISPIFHIIYTSYMVKNVSTRGN